MNPAGRPIFQPEGYAAGLAAPNEKALLKQDFFIHGGNSRIIALG
jgi:hypothetical protein